jgi:tRNA uridine 5-carboxymethylaminomethyl modification enzyme
VSARRYELVVVGAGHAGCEAALAAARMGCDVALVALAADAVARMSCNPALGGLGKGHLVREVDALGGAMGLVGDATGIQFRRLNRRKGAAVRATRVQSDRRRYAQAMRELVARTPRLELLEAEVEAVEVRGGRVVGVTLADAARSSLECAGAVLTTGTFLRGMIHVGLESHPGGRDGERAARGLSASLAALGLRLGRLKTGTPCRLDRASVDLARLEAQPGDEPPPRLSFASEWPAGRPPLPQRACHLTWTNGRTHELVRASLDRSPLYSGLIEGVGPRYCPSIEDKVVRFPDRERHQIFLEPEGLDVPELYPNGISTSLPADVQLALVHSIAGLEAAVLTRPGYAVEYDFVDPTQLDTTLAVRGIEGLHLAGQINGSSGYEEAAGQGIVAGINAALRVRGREPIALRRDQAYIGVLVDDLVLRGTREPYRMFTARAEHRLLLREDNADARLTPLGRELGLVDEPRWRAFAARQERIARLGRALAETRVPAACTALDERLAAADGAAARPGTPLVELLRRPEVGLELLFAAGLLEAELASDPLGCEQAEIAIKYEGYVRRQLEAAARLRRLEDRQLPAELDPAAIFGLRAEAREQLARIRPRTLGEAARIPGVTPAAIALLEVHLRRIEESGRRRGRPDAEHR